MFYYLKTASSSSHGKFVAPTIKGKYNKIHQIIYKNKDNKHL